MEVKVKRVRRNLNLLKEVLLWTLLRILAQKTRTFWVQEKVVLCGVWVTQVDVNATKSKVMVDREGEFDCSVRINELTLEALGKFVYLGAVVDNLREVENHVAN